MTQAERPGEAVERPGAALLDARIQSLTDRLVLSVSPAPSALQMATICAPSACMPPSDADSVCADIDRWASSSLGDSSSQINESAKIRELEEEQARLSESVLALSTHFAHMQFRIQQISAAPVDERDSMLKELQEFASKGCVDLGQLKRDAEQLMSSSTDPDLGQHSTPIAMEPTEAKAKSHVVSLIERLRAELEELERFAYESGQHGAPLPLSELKQRQKLVFDKLQEKIRLKIELEKLSGSEFQRTVEEDIEQVLNPMREKDKLVDQLQTQIVDLERFVAFLQQECAQLAPGDGFLAYNADEFLAADSFDAAARAQKMSVAITASGLPADFWLKESMGSYVVRQKHSLAALIGRSASVESAGGESPAGSPTSLSPLPVAVAAISGGGRAGGISAMMPAVQRSQSVTSGWAPSGQPSTVASASSRSSWAQRWLGCRSNRRFEKNELKRTPLGNHYGDQRARMELAVHAVTQVMQKHQILSVDRSDRDPMPVERIDELTLFECSDEAIVGVVRKEFCVALGELLAHGMRAAVAPNCTLRDDSGATGDGLVLPSLPVPVFLGCGSQRHGAQSSYANRISIALKRFDNQRLDHIWDVISLFYECSRALEMRDAAVGRLSDAYKLETIDGRTATSKQVLLATVENVRSTHSRLQRSRNAMWKAFVSAALNNNRLPGWIRIVFRSTFILKKCYHSWAYVARTGCEDIRPLLERLHEYNFDLPVDLAVRPFEHIKEAF